MIRPLPHRTGRGACRECGMFDLYSAPDNCARCALARYAERGYRIVGDPVYLLERELQLMWTRIAHDLSRGSLRSGSFCVYVGYGDGAELVPPNGDLSPREREFVSHRAAQAAGQALLQRYPQVWVMTTVGGWNVRLPTAR